VESSFSYPYLPQFQFNSELLANNINESLDRVWGVMEAFSTTINLAAETRGKYPVETLLRIKASVMYRLLNLSFETGSLDEMIRLSLLAFTFGIFLQWQGIRQRPLHLRKAYKKCLFVFKRMDDVIPRILLWILMVGELSVFDESDHHWLRPRLQAAIALCGVRSWSEMRDILDSFMWIGLVHENRGKAVYESVSSPQ
jgi:hypothetical protein